MFMPFGSLLPANTPPRELKLAWVNEFIGNTRLIAPNRAGAFYYQEKKEKKEETESVYCYVFWYSKRLKGVNIQARSFFEQKKNQDTRIGVQGGDIKVTYYSRGKPVRELPKAKIEMLERLFDHLKVICAAKVTGESSEGFRSSGIRSSVEIFEYCRYSELTKTFFPPKEELILQSYREKYSRLGPAEKNTLQRRASPGDVANKSLNSGATQAYIYQMSVELFGAFKEGLIFSVGQSPAWFAAMAQIHQPNPQRFCHVAFNGCWHRLEDCPGKECLTLKIIQDNIPTYDQLKSYRSYLSRIGCSPQRILGQKEPSLIVNYVHRAGGVKSFLQFLFVWAKEEGIDIKLLKKKLIIQCLHDKNLSFSAPGNDLRKYLQQNLEEYSIYPIIAIAVEPNIFQLQGNSKNLTSTRDNILKADCSLVKFFPTKEWTPENCKKSSFSHDEEHKHIFPIYAGFIETAEQMMKEKVS